MMQIETLQHFLRAIGHALMLGDGLLRRGDRDQFHLRELMHPDHAPRVLSRRARFQAEAWRVSGEAIRELSFFEYLSVHIIGEGNFGSGNEPKPIRKLSRFHTSGKSFQPSKHIWKSVLRP